jgi:toxin HigB-1
MSRASSSRRWGVFDWVRRQPPQTRHGGVPRLPAPHDLAGFWAVSISENWRVIFRFDGEHALDVDLIDYH